MRKFTRYPRNIMASSDPSDLSKEELLSMLYDTIYWICEHETVAEDFVRAYPEIAEYFYEDYGWDDEDDEE